MKTTIDIPEETLRCAMNFANAKTKRHAVLTALEEFNSRRRRNELVKHLGTFGSLMTNDQIEELEEKRGGKKKDRRA